MCTYFADTNNVGYVNFCWIIPIMLKIRFEYIYEYR
jgi:hypothetical protein